MDEGLQQKLLRAIIDGRLIIFCGAGLSMADPSKVPSAEQLARECVAEYRKRYGSAVDDLPAESERELEVLATHFYGRGELQAVFIDQLFHSSIRPFTRDPNEGHYAIADFLACGAIAFAVSTNVDVLIELAASDLGEPKPEVAIELAEVARVRDHYPHIKLHGCICRNSAQTLWCKGQLGKLGDPPFCERIREFHGWLPGALMGKVLIFVGFWSDWSYLNAVFQAAIKDLEPSSIVLVNPSDVEMLAAKAPQLWHWAHNDRVEFVHLKESGAAFLDDLRLAYSGWYVRQVLSAASPAYTRLTGITPPDFTAALAADNGEFYSMRRDLTGTLDGEAVRSKLPSEQMEMIGVCHLKLIAGGAVRDGSRYILNGNRIRVVSGEGRLLSSVRQKYAAETPTRMADNVVICVGARDDGEAVTNIMRPEPDSSIARPWSFARWMTDDAIESL